MTEQAKDRHYECAGFLFIGNRSWYTDPEDYLDWIGFAWTFMDFNRDLNSGCLPVGMLINVEDYVPMVVTRSPGLDDWKVVPITDYYTTLAFADCPIYGTMAV